MIMTMWYKNRILWKHLKEQAHVYGISEGFWKGVKSKLELEEFIVHH